MLVILKTMVLLFLCVMGCYYYFKQKEQERKERRRRGREEGLEGREGRRRC